MCSRLKLDYDASRPAAKHWPKKGCRLIAKHMSNEAISLYKTLSLGNLSALGSIQYWFNISGHKNINNPVRYLYSVSLLKHLGFFTNINVGLTTLDPLPGLTDYLSISHFFVGCFLVSVSVSDVMPTSITSGVKSQFLLLFYLKQMKRNANRSGDHTELQKVKLNC